VPQELDATAEFRVEDGDGQLRLTVQLPATWKFSTGFFAPIAADDDGSFLFDGLTIQSAQLILDSKGDAVAGLSQGVNYRGTLQVAGSLETLGWLLGDAATVDISGGIAFTDSGHPEMDLRCKALGVRQIGQFRLGFALHLTTKFLDEEDILDASFRLVTTLNVTLKGSTTGLTVVGEFRRHPGILVFQASIASGIATSLSDLATLANGAELTTALPDGFDAGRALALSELRFVVDTNEQNLTTPDKN